MQFARILWETLSSNWSWVSLLDVILVALGVYYLLLLVRGTRAIQLLKGVAVLLLLIAVTRALGLMTFNWLLSQALLPGVIALVILFQPELRLALERLVRQPRQRDGGPRGGRDRGGGAAALAREDRRAHRLRAQRGAAGHH
jgi:DNA integrity scanning protein DisA with diadenylate cyclase activity